MAKRLTKALGVLLVALLATCLLALPAFAYTIHSDGTITFDDGSYPTGYKLSFDLPEGVTFGEAGGVWADWIRDAYAVPNEEATVSGGYDYYCWDDKSSGFSFNIPADYILEEAELVPASAGEIQEVDSWGFVMLSLNAPATLKLTLGQVTWNNTYTDLTTGVSITLSSVEAKKVEGATFFSRKVDDYDEVGYIQSACMKAIDELPASESYSPTGMVAYDTAFSSGSTPFFPTSYIGWNQYPFYVTIPLPDGWSAEGVHAYHYWAEPGGGEYAQVTAREFTVANGGRAVTVTENAGAYYGRYVLVYDGTVTPTIKTGWQEEDGGWRYYDSDGTMHTGWLQEGKAWYYFGVDGLLVTNGWAWLNGMRYYMGKNGQLAKNTWAQVDGEWYYIGSDYQPTVKNWVSYGGKYFYMDADGHVTINGWASYQGKYFYMGSNGQAVVNQWKQIDGTWYHFNKSGVCDQVWNG